MTLNSYPGDVPFYVSSRNLKKSKMLSHVCILLQKYGELTEPGRFIKYYQKANLIFYNKTNKQNSCPHQN